MKKWISLMCVCAILAACLPVASFAAETDKNSSQTETASQQAQQMLNLKATYERPFYKKIPLEGISKRYEEVECFHLKDVEIQLENGMVPLEEALLKKMVTVEELVCYARMDAAQGFCAETMSSKNGLTKYIYHYPDFDVVHCYDVYETPDGHQNPIAEFTLADNGEDIYLSPENKETRLPLDWEDWGLTLEMTKQNKDSIAVKITQSGGQQFGKLFVYGIGMLKMNPEKGFMEIYRPLPGRKEPGIENLDETIPPEAFLKMNGTRNVVVDLEPWGDLPPGEYSLDFFVADQFDKESLHPFTRDFQQFQDYGVTFTVK